MAAGFPLAEHSQTSQDLPQNAREGETVGYGGETLNGLKGTLDLQIVSEGILGELELLIFNRNRNHLPAITCRNPGHSAREEQRKCFLLECLTHCEFLELFLLLIETTLLGSAVCSPSSLPKKQEQIPTSAVGFEEQTLRGAAAPPSPKSPRLTEGHVLVFCLLLVDPLVLGSDLPGKFQPGAGKSSGIMSHWAERGEFPMGTFLILMILYNSSKSE